MAETRKTIPLIRRLDGLTAIILTLASLQIGVLISAMFENSALIHGLYAVLVALVGFLTREFGSKRNQLRFLGSALAFSAVINLIYIGGYFLDRGGFVYTTAFLVACVVGIFWLRKIWKRTISLGQ